MFRLSYLIVFVTFTTSNVNYAFASNCTFGGVDFDNLNSRQQSVLEKYGAICSSPSSQNFKYRTGINYTNYSDGSCTPGRKKVCINSSEYKELCNMAKGISVQARRTASVMYGSSFSRFLGYDGVFESQRVDYRNNRCAVSFTISGIFKGTTTRKTIYGRGSTFIVTKNGNVLVHYIDTMR
tara:strand:- start:3069 stop:3611 length:543 start_codon:yes stop_codon:yes gene_type:complete